MKITALTSCCVDFFPELGDVLVGGNSLNFATQCNLSGINDFSLLFGTDCNEFYICVIDFPGHGKSDRLKKLNTDFPCFNSMVCYVLFEQVKIVFLK